MKTSRAALLEIGAEIVCRQGFGGLSFGAIADRAGIRKASIHHHFPAKADFARALIAHHAQKIAAELTEAECDTRRGYLALRALLRARRERVGEGAGVDLLTALTADARTLDGPARAALAETRELVVRRIAAVLLTGRRDRTIAVAGDIEDEARAALAQIEGAELAARAAGGAAMFDRTIAMLEKRMAAH